MKHSRIHIDFEVYSEALLDEVGLYQYAAHESTELICLAHAAEGQEEQLWLPGFPFPRDLYAKIKNGDTFCAVNASFERVVWHLLGVRKYDFPPVPFSQWECVALKAAACGLPRGLQKLSEYLDLGNNGKDKEGHKIMLKVCKPDSKNNRNTDPTLLSKTRSYCCQDVRAEKEVDKFCEPLPPQVLKIWQLAEKINQRGLPIDVDLCRGAMHLANTVRARAAEDCLRVSGGTIEKPTQRQRIKDFAEERGVVLPNMQAETLAEALEGELPEDVRILLQARASTGKTSIDKFAAALRNVNPDGRARDQFVYYAAITGRWAGKNIQPQNLKKQDDPVPPALIQAIKDRDVAAVEEYGDLFSVLSNTVRSMIWAPGWRKLIDSDFKAIEARVLHWLAGDEETLQKFREGVDLYIDMAAKVYDISPEEVDKAKRQIGKAAILGLGFRQGAKGFQRHCKNNGIEIEEDFAQSVVDVFRSTFVPATKLWKELDRAALLCVKTGKTITGEKFVFRKEREWLTMELPSGRKLYYFRPQINPDGPYGPEVYYQSPRQLGKVLSGPTLIENFVQAVAGDLINEAMLRMDNEGLFVIGTVHDSVIVEDGLCNLTGPERVHAIMEQVPSWAEGLPIAADTKVCTRLS